MTPCDRLDAGAVEQYFYGDLPAGAVPRTEEHLRACATCRAHLADLQALSEALSRPAVVDAPPAGDWSGFMRRLEEQTTRRRPVRSPVGRRLASWAAAAAAVLVIAVAGTLLAWRGVRSGPPARPQPPTPVATVQASQPSSRARLQTAAAEHLERSKVVVLDLAMRDPREKPAAWQDERRLAQGLLSDTRLYRLTAEEKGMTDIAHVMGDLETVLVEASMSDSRDPEALARVQRLIAKRDLLMKMQVVSAWDESGT